MMVVDFQGGKFKVRGGQDRWENLLIKASNKIYLIGPRISWKVAWNVEFLWFSMFWSRLINNFNQKGELEGVLARRFNRTVKIVGAGRTDSGVHARGQAFHFDVFLPEITSKQLQSKLSRNGEIIDFDEKYCFDFCHQLQASLNSMLQQDMRGKVVPLYQLFITSDFMNEGTISYYQIT